MTDTATSNELVYYISAIKNVAEMACFGYPYLQCTFNPTRGEFMIFPTKQIETYENLEEDTQIRLNLTIQCPHNNTKTMFFYQDIIDTNNHVPIFSSSTYNFVFYNSIPKSFDVTEFQEIKVTDEDLTTKNCQFKIVGNDDFSIKSSSSIIHKECNTILAPKQTINPPFDKTLFLEVEDDGIPSQKSLAKIQVVVKWNLAFDPKFTHLNYLMKMEETNVIAPNGYPVPKSVNGIDSDTKVAFVDKEFERVFRLKPDRLTSEIRVELQDNMVWFHCESVSFKIMANERGIVSH